MNYKEVIDKFYPEDNELKRLLLRHSTDVAGKALEIAHRNPQLNIDTDFLLEGAMLHDIGIFMTDAPGIFCYGNQPYIKHGIIGAALLRELGWERHARVCERHTGTGITKKQIIERQLPLPLIDLVPETIEEQVICYADKFYSKSHPEITKTVEQARQSLMKFGEHGIEVFDQWTKLFKQ